MIQTSGLLDAGIDNFRESTDFAEFDVTGLSLTLLISEFLPSSSNLLSISSRRDLLLGLPTK